MLPKAEIMIFEKENILNILFNKIRTSNLPDEQKQILLKRLENCPEEDLKIMVLTLLEEVDIEKLLKLIKLSYEEFVRRAVTRLKEKSYKGIHSVYSGFNDAFRRYYDEDPVKIIRELSAEGKVFLRPARGGFIIYLPENTPQEIKRLNVFLKEIKKLDSLAKIKQEDQYRIIIFSLYNDETEFAELQKSYGKTIINEVSKELQNALMQFLELENGDEERDIKRKLKELGLTYPLFIED
jgi:hypothetical protein